MDPKLRELRAILQPMGRVLVAYSGGVDSSFLLWAATETLGRDRVLAVTATSPIVAPKDLARAQDVATQLRVQHLMIPTGQMEDQQFLQNSVQRCYYCKRETLSRLVEMAQEKGFPWVVEGSNVDDREEFRPGKQAVTELGVRSPLEEACLTKADIRELSRQVGLPTWHLPAQTCLATRFPHAAPLTMQGLNQVAQAEAVLQQMGFDQVRVRHHGAIARIEVPGDQIEQLAAPDTSARVVAALRLVGFDYVTADLDGYRRGNLSELPDATAG
jgi:uncharacterized protein